MAHRLHLHHLERETIARANRALLLGLVWGGLAACVIAALIYDIGRWTGRW